MKQLHIRNSYHGMIWQVYTINNPDEAVILKRNATGNGFMFHEVVECEPGAAYKETFPGWRDTDGWKQCWNDYISLNNEKEGLS